MKKIIKFSASWCQPCKVFAPIFNEVSQMGEFKDITFTTIDIDDDEEGLSQKYNIRGVPSVVIISDEESTPKIITGAVPKQQFINILREELQCNNE